MAGPYRSAEKNTEERSLTLAMTGRRWLGQAPRIFVQMWFLFVPAILLGPFSPVAALTLVGAAVAWVVFDTKRRFRRDQVHVAVDGTSLQIKVGDGPTVQLPLSSLLDVRLDSKVVHKAIGHARADGLNTVFGPAIAGGPTFESDECRLELVLDGRPPITLGDERAPRGHALDIMRTMRLFLRRNGWVPEDERPGAAEPTPKKKSKKSFGGRGPRAAS